MSDMDIPEISTIDGLLAQLGDCGLFQVMAVTAFHGSSIVAMWSMMFMAYGNFNPGWDCADPDLNLSLALRDGEGEFGRYPSNDTEERAYTSNDTEGRAYTSNDTEGRASCEVYKYCKNVVFKNDTSTIVTEWNLACDNSWIPSLIISLQMGGVLIGSLLAGQLNIHLGRKAMLYGSLFLHAILNLTASFSVNWPMFASLRFLLGITCGSLIMCAFVYPLEFITNRWRGVVAAIPFSSTGSLTFALSAMFLRDWRNLHRATAILTTVLFLPVFWAPDSIRWLALKGKHQKAVDVGLKIAKINRKPPVNMEVIDQVAEKERKIEESKRHFSILDLYRHGLLTRTFVLTLAWVTNTIVYYAFVYDVKSLSGNFFVNLILFSLITLISLPFVPLFTNTLGRRWGIIVLMGLASVGCVVLVVMNFVETKMDKGMAKLVVILIITIFIDAEWAIVQLYCVESYPTVLRSLSYCHGSCVARVGGILAPLLIPRHQSVAYISQLIMMVLIAFTCVSFFFLPETKGKHLEESVEVKGDRKTAMHRETEEAAFRLKEEAAERQL